MKMEIVHKPSSFAMKYLGDKSFEPHLASFLDNISKAKRFQRSQRRRKLKENRKFSFFS
jgi:hypothetical protein